MRWKLAYTAPISVTDSLDEPVKDVRILKSLAGISCLQGTVLQYLNTDLPDRADLRGGYLRLVRNGRRLQLRIEIDAPRKLNKSELSALRKELDGQVSDGIGEGGFDFVSAATTVSITTFPGRGRKRSSITQTPGNAWRPASRAAETAANRRRCKAVAAAVRTADRADEMARQKKTSAKPDPKALFKLWQKAHTHPRPRGIEKQIAAEIANLGGDLSFIQPGQLPFLRPNDPPLLRLLLDANLNPNLHDREGHSLLWLASRNPESLKLLLDRGADINLRNTMVYQDTALMDAAFAGAAESVRLLLARGADPRLKDRFGETALTKARNNPYYGQPAATVAALKKRNK